MEKVKWAALGISLLLAVSPPAQAQTATTAFQPKESTYVIRNMETGMFMQSSTDLAVNNKAAYFGAMNDKNSSDYFLWQFKASGTGWKIQNVGREEKGKGSWLTDTKTADVSGTYRGTMSSKETYGATWYISTNTLNPNGYLVSSAEITSNTPPTYCLYAYKASDGTTYLCSSEKEAIDLNQHEWATKTYYQLPTFQFYSYDDLYTLARSCGYTGSEVSNPTAADFATLAKQIEAANPVTSTSVASEDKYYVIASRRYHKFLSIDNKGNFHSADKITTSSVFSANSPSSGVRYFSSLYHGDGKAFTLYHANNGHANDYKLSTGKDGNNLVYLCVDNNGLVSSSARTANKDLALLDDEWVIAESPYHKNDFENLQYINVSKTDLYDIEDWYFRIENNAKRIKLMTNSDDSKNVGGYLNDVDKTATEKFDQNAGKGTTIHFADIFSNSVNIRDAANIWRITQVVAGADGNNNPIGIVSNFTHSLYYIQNANSGKYIGEPTGTSQLMPLISETADKSSRALFYFLPKDDNNDTGEYALMLLDRGKTNTQNEEVAKGWLDIADTDNGTPNTDVVPNLTQAGLIYRPVETTTTSNDYAYDWSLHRARFIEARSAAIENFNGYRYVTIWFPFDIINNDPNVSLWTAEWRTDYSGINFKRMEQGQVLPAKHGALALAPDNDSYKLIKFALANGEASAYPSDIDSDILLGVAESEDYKLGDSDNGDIHNRNGIYVFSMTQKTDDKNNPYQDSKELTLGHPADDFLMANRCYVKATTESEKVIASGKAFTFSFDENGTDGIRDINATAVRHQRYFDLQGREVSHPQHGIYITNGKKIYLK